MAILTLGTGALDAATYLGLDHVFGANMTGNLVLVGIALGTGEFSHFFGPLLALGGFIVGAGLAGVLQIVLTTSRRFAAIAYVLTFLLLASTLALTHAVDSSTSAVLAITVIVGVAMGVQSVLARVIGVKDVTTVVVTSTLSVLSSDHRAWLTPEGRANIAHRGSSLVTMALGALIGAFLLQVHLWLAITFALVCMAFSIASVMLRRWDFSSRV